MKMMKTTLLALLITLPAACGSVQTSDGADAGANADASEEVVDESAPRLVAASPEDGASGLFDDALVVLTFSEAMDQESVENTLDTASLGAITTVWNPAGDTLTIVPDVPLEYAEGEGDPNSISPNDYRVIVGESATDRAGNELQERISVNFTTLKNMGVTLRPVAEMSRVATPVNFLFDTDAPFVVGDRLGVTEEGMRSAMTFDLSSIPAEAVGIQSAELSTRQLIGDTQGDPFGDLGPVLLLDHVTFSETGGANSAFNANQGAHASLGSFFVEDQITVEKDVREAVADDLQERAVRESRSQFLARFETISNLDKGNDRAVFSRDALELSVRYLHP